MQRKTKTLTLTCGVLLGAMMLVWLARTPQLPSTALSYSQFIGRVQGGQMAHVVVLDGNSGATRAICRMKDGTTARTVLPADYRDAMHEMGQHVVDIEIREGPAWPVRGFINATPFLSLLCLWVVLVMLKLRRGPMANLGT